nr:Mut7-C RNAse domain-containing protein [Halomarina rubra]
MLDAMCGGLRSYLRMCGHDTVFVLDRGGEAEHGGASGRTGGDATREAEGSAFALGLAVGEDRTLVTRNVQLAERVDDAILLRERDPVEQLRELHGAGVDLTLDERPAFCGVCNGPLDRVGPDEPTADYAPDAHDEAVWRCRDCGQQFWMGSHWERVAETLRAVRASSNTSEE